MRPEAAPWVRQAEADLLAARDSYSSDHYEWACFQAQQAAEKALKAFLWENTGQHPGKSHVLYDVAGGSLLDHCQEFDSSFSNLVGEADLLRPHETASRYPDESTYLQAPADYYQPIDAVSCIEAAQSIVEFVKSRLGN